MATKRGKFDGLLGDVSGSESDASTSGSDGEDEGAGDAPPASKRAKPAAPQPEITVEDLERAGYRSGPSVLYMKTPQDEEPQDWSWGDGKAAKSHEAREETDQERQATRVAVSEGLEESARLAHVAAAHAAKLKQQGWEEKQQLAKDKRLSFNQKEKRKRDMGMSSRGKNYVEEEKRQARGLGIYSGFDK